MVGLRPEWTVKAMVVIIVASILFRCVSAAMNHTVGGLSGWDLSSNLQAWTSNTTFHVGDSLVFSYTPMHDVVEVDPAGFQSCDPSSPIATHNDGETVVPLGQEGGRYFICGHQGHCQMGLKLQVQVLATEHQNASSSEQRARGKGKGGGTGRGGGHGDINWDPPASQPSPALPNCTRGIDKARQFWFFRPMALIIVSLGIVLVDSWLSWEIGFVF